MEEPILLTAQEAAERLLTIKIGGFLLFLIVVFGCIWVIIRWKYGEDRKRTIAKSELAEAENAKERIRVTENIGKAMTDVLKEDSGWKVQYFILKAKYDALEEHAKSMERTLDTATGANGFKPQEMLYGSNHG